MMMWGPTCRLFLSNCRQETSLALLSNAPNFMRGLLLFCSPLPIFPTLQDSALRSQGAQTPLGISPCAVCTCTDPIEPLFSVGGVIGSHPQALHFPLRIVLVWTQPFRWRSLLWGEPSPPPWPLPGVAPGGAKEPQVQRQVHSLETHPTSAPLTDSLLIKSTQSASPAATPGAWQLLENRESFKLYFPSARVASSPTKSFLCG